MLGSDGISSKKSPRVVRGQLFLPTQGATGGILFGGDVPLFRRSAGTLELNAILWMTTAQSIYFRDVGVHINSGTDGHLDLDADIAIDLNALAVTLLNTATGSLPAGPEGSIAYDATLNKLVVYTGAAWETITSV